MKKYTVKYYFLNPANNCEEYYISKKDAAVAARKFGGQVELLKFSRLIACKYDGENRLRWVGGVK